MDNKYVRMQKRIAMGDPDALSGDFGVDSLASHAAGGPAGNTAGKQLADHERGARPPINGNQANPDHGYKGK